MENRRRQNAADPTDEEVIEEEGTEEELELTEAEIENVKLKEKITELEKPKTPAAVSYYSCKYGSVL